MTVDPKCGCAWCSAHQDDRPPRHETTTDFCVACCEFTPNRGGSTCSVCDAPYDDPSCQQVVPC